MSQGYSFLVVQGNLGTDPEMRYTQAGVAYARFSLAVNRQWTEQSGAKREEVTWYRVTVFGKMAEACNEHLSKGDSVLIDSEGVKATAYIHEATHEARASLDMIAKTVRFLSVSKWGKSDRPQAAPEVEEDEIPF